MIFKTLLASSLLTLSLAGTTASAADLTLTFTNVKKETGAIMIALYNEEKGFLSPDGAIAFGRVMASETPASFTFKDLAPGDYAISAYHDVDDNGKMKTNFMGIPREPVGMSRDAKGVMGPPSYDDAVFTLTEENHEMSIELY